MNCFYSKSEKESSTFIDAVNINRHVVHREGFSVINHPYQVFLDIYGKLVVCCASNNRD